MFQHYDFDGFHFETGPDPENAARMRVRVFRDGEPFTDLHGAQMDKTYPATVDPRRVEQFCRRFATDSAYRNQVLLKHAFACC